MTTRIILNSYFGIILLTLFVQFSLVSVSFPITELLSHTPLLHIDSAHHWYQINFAVELAKQGNLIGYDPFFAAGYMGGIPYNTSAKVPALIAVLFPWATPAIAFKLFSFICAVLSPVALVLTARTLKLGVHVGGAVALLAIILWWASPIRWSHTAGIVAWPFIVFITILFAANLVTYIIGRGNNWSCLWLALSSGILFLVHPLFPMAAIFAIIPLFIVFRKEIIPKKLIFLLVIVPVVGVSLNMPWVSVLINYPGMADGTQPYQQAVDINMIWQNMLGLPSQDRGSKFYFMLVALSLWGIVGQSNKIERVLAITLFAAGICTLIFAAIGALIPVIAITQPNRFGIQGYVMMLIPAAIGVINILRAIRVNRIARIAGIGSCLFGVATLLYFMNDIRREITPGMHSRHGDAPPQVRDIGPLSRWMLDRLNYETDTSARVMFELSHARVHDGAHIAGFLATKSNREFIGGAYPYTHFTNFQDNWAFGRELSSLPKKMFLEYLELYNIGWILVHSEIAKYYLSNIPDVTLISENDQLSFYRIEHKLSFFIEGTGTISSRTANQLSLSDLKGDVLVLKYHYVPGMRSDPPVAIDGIKMLNDPQPFIRITRPPRTLRIYVP